MNYLTRSSMAIADRFIVKMKRAVWSTWTVQKSVNEGYKVSGWVYAAVRHIVQAASSVPLVVFKDGEINEKHPISILLKHPCQSLSGQDFIELIVAWLQLTGRAPFKKIMVGTRTKELQLISPDRIAPIASEDVAYLIAGYELDEQRTNDLTPENVCYLRLLDPANPINGIGPLQAAAREVDCDVEQQEWNKSAMENRGVVDGVFTFKKDLTQTLGDAILAKIKEKFGNKGKVREPLVLGSDATYTRVGLNAAEMDFIESRKFNREAVFVIFNVPLALVSSESMTYNNYTSALRILYESNVIPLLDDIYSELNFSFAKELQPGEEIKPDLTNISALKEQDSEKINNAKTLYSIGVPISAINARLELGLEAFDSWDQPWGGFPPRASLQPFDPTQQRTAQPIDVRMKPMEQRDIAAEQDARERIASTSVSAMFSKLLDEQRGGVKSAIEGGRDPIAAIKSTRGTWVEAVDNKAHELAAQFSKGFVTNRAGLAVGREVRAVITDAIKEYLVQEAYALNEVSGMEETTAAGVTAMVQNGIEKDQTPTEIMQAIDDIGLFSAARSLMLARTLTGTAQSIGQLGGAMAANAKTKTWMAGNYVNENAPRELHKQRDGVAVPIDGTWDNGPTPMRFPLDPKGDPGDRINCRCAMSFD